MILLMSGINPMLNILSASSITSCSTCPKFTVPDPVVYWSLQTIDHLAGYSLSTTQVKPVWDTYLDTKRHRILRGLSRWLSGRIMCRISSR